MKMLKGFLRECKGTICLFIGVCGVFVLVLYLQNIPLDAVAYASLLCLFLLFVYEIGAFICYARHYATVAEAKRKITSELAELPVRCSLIEKEYQEMVQTLFSDKLELESAGRISRQSMLNYYSMWVHQIKTPIAAMRLLLQSCEEQEADISALKEMKLELFKIEQYVEMVLAYLRMDTMSSDLVLEWYSLDDIIRQAVRKYSKMFILQKIKLQFEPTGEMILTDEKWLMLVLEQLLSNALKYTKQGGISIYMKEMQQKVLVIEDTGIGIYAEDLPRVFDKGFTGYNGRNDKKSTGIGLYLCKSVMDKLRHQIWMESEAGRGTRVFLALTREELHPE